MNQAQRLDLSTYADAPAGVVLRLLFIHHSCGGQLLAPPGHDLGTNCIYTSHPNGGGLRPRLEQQGYEVHEASYGSRIGARTDIFDWLPKFQHQMEAVLACRHQDNPYTDGRRNHIIAFKSCFPNNQFTAAGTPPGNPQGPELTVWNAKAVYRALLKEFGKYPDVLFVCVTAPPVAPAAAPGAGWKRIARALLGRAHAQPARAALAREFNHWLSRPEGWLAEARLRNVAVFDYYDILTDRGASDFSCYPTCAGQDSHPSREGNERAAAEFIPFLDRAVRRAGLVPETTTINHEPFTAAGNPTANTL